MFLGLRIRKYIRPALDPAPDPAPDLAPDPSIIKQSSILLLNSTVL
jgi:hypothetical protein